MRGVLKDREEVRNSRDEGELVAAKVAVFGVGNPGRDGGGEERDSREELHRDSFG